MAQALPSVGDWYELTDSPNCFCRREGANAVVLIPGPILITAARQVFQGIGLKTGAKVEDQLLLHAQHAKARKEGRMLFAVQGRNKIA